MKKFVFILIGLITIGVVATGITSCSNNDTQQEEAVQYHCPMHPTVISDRPGSCKICGMDLVPIEESEEYFEEEDNAASKEHEGLHTKADKKESAKKDEHAKHGQVMGYTKVRVNPERQQLIGIRLATVEKRVLQKQVRVVGEVAHDPEMYQAQTEYLKTGGYSGDTGLRESARLKLEHMGMSRKQILGLEQQGKAKQNLIVSGKDSTYWIYVYFYEMDLPFAKEGQNVSITVPMLDNKRYSGKLKALRAHIDTQTRSIRGIVEVKDAQLDLRPGLFVNAEVGVTLSESLVIPLSAVMDSGERQIVFVKKGKGTFEPRQVKLGGVAGDYAQVKSGVSAEEEVVVRANFMIDSESRLRAVIESSGQPAGHQH